MGTEGQRSFFRLFGFYFAFIFSLEDSLWDVLNDYCLSLTDELTVPYGQVVTMLWGKAEAPFELKRFIHSFIE